MLLYYLFHHATEFVVYFLVLSIVYCTYLFDCFMQLIFCNLVAKHIHEI